MNKVKNCSLSKKTQRCFCQNCGGLLGTLNKGYPNVCITIASLKNPNLIVPDKQHSYKENAPLGGKSVL